MGTQYSTTSVLQRPNEKAGPGKSILPRTGLVCHVSEGFKDSRIRGIEGAGDMEYLFRLLTPGFWLLS